VEILKFVGKSFLLGLGQFILGGSLVMGAYMGFSPIPHYELLHFNVFT